MTHPRNPSSARWIAGSAIFQNPLSHAKIGLDKMNGAAVAFGVLGVSVVVNLVAMPAGAPLIIMPGDAYQPTVTDQVTTVLGALAFMQCGLNLVQGSIHLRKAQTLLRELLGRNIEVEVDQTPQTNALPGFDQATMKAADWLATQIPSISRRKPSP